MALGRSTVESLPKPSKAAWGHGCAPPSVVTLPFKVLNWHGARSCPGARLTPELGIYKQLWVYKNQKHIPAPSPTEYVKIQKQPQKERRN